MKVRTRLLLAMALTMAFAVLSVRFISGDAMLHGFSTLDETRARADVAKVDQALRGMVTELDRKSVDWASWDDTYAYVQDRNPGYIQSNISTESFRNLGVDMLLILDKSQNEVYSFSAPSIDDRKRLDAGDLWKTLVRHGYLSRIPELSAGKSGIAMVGASPVLVSIRPIRDTNEKLPSRGWLVFARYLKAPALDDLRRITRQDVGIQVFSFQDPEAKSLASSLIGGQSAVIRVRDNVTAEGFSLVRDIHGSPAILLKTALRRSTYVFGMGVVDSIMIQLVGLGAAFSVVIFFIFEKFALARLRSLGRQVAAVGNDASGTRVCLQGGDELTDLAGHINEMLAKIDASAAELRASQEKLRTHNENLEVLVQERTREIEHQAFHDKLTNLPNRSLFMDRLHFALAKARRSGLGTAVLFIDLDNFKLVNDSLGHDVGDLLLTEVADRFVCSVRPGDTVARLGGDEFTVLLEDLANVEEASEVAKRLLQGLKKPINLGTRETFACASIGLAYSDDHAIGGDKFLKNADTAMYRAKAAGKSSYVIFDDSMHDHAMERLEMETDLRRALENDEIFVAFQPIVNLQTGMAIEAEALARWKHPSKGLISPNQFIPIAEDTGLIVPIGYWILEQACTQGQKWRLGSGGPDFVMSVNLSGKQLQRDDVLGRVRGILERTQLPPQNLKLEITESVLMEDRIDVAMKLQGLKEMGIKLALDDFGTGYSSLSTLQAFPIDTLKVDRGFISLLGLEEGSMAIVQAIVALAGTMKMSVTGEGVETHPQEKIIRELGVETVQGFLYDQPLRADEFEARMNDGSLAQISEENQRKAA